MVERSNSHTFGDDLTVHSPGEKGTIMVLQNLVDYIKLMEFVVQSVEHGL